MIDGLTLQVPEGEICGFLGGNGSGKTTTIRMLCGLLRPDGGGGTCLGLDLLRDAARIRLQIGYMTQRFSFYGDLTVAENLEFVARLYADPRPSARPSPRCWSASAWPIAPTSSPQELSGGWKQRMALAACVLHRPRLLLLDEPTAGVDAKARREFWDMIHEMAADGMTVLVSTHYMDEAERCQRVVYLAGGRLVVQGTRGRGGAGRASGDVRGDRRRASNRRCAGCAACRAWRPPPCSAARCASPAWTASRCAPRSTASAMTQLHWQEVEPRLDDVFIHMLNQQDDRGMSGFSFARLFAMLRKEWLQMRRDRATSALTVMLPLIQLFLFGYRDQRQPAPPADRR